MEVALVERRLLTPPAGLTILRVVGSSYRPPEAQRVLNAATQHTPCVLMPEPSNDHDYYATRVMMFNAGRWVFVGYIAANMAKYMYQWRIEERVPRAAIITAKVAIRDATVVVEPYGAIDVSEMDAYASAIQSGV